LYRRFGGLLLVLLLAAMTAPAFAQGLDLAGRPVKEVRISGLERVQPQLVLNQVRTEPGQPYDPEQVALDIRNITRLGRFATVRADVKQGPDGGVILTYIVEEQPLLADVQVVGNKAIADQELLGLVLLRGGDPLDEFLIERAIKQIRQAYREEGYYLADASVDPQALEENDVLIFRVREGPKVRIKQLVFTGNSAFTEDQLESEIETEQAALFAKGVLAEEQLDQDVGRLRDFYRDHGYLDARVDRRIQLSPDQKGAAVNFIIEEGRQYTVGQIAFDLPADATFSSDTLREAMILKQGSVYSAELLRDTTEALRDLYGKLGYLSPAEGGQTIVRIDRVFAEGQPVVNLTVRVREGQRYTVGNVIVRGNRDTQDRVIRRELRHLEPGRRFDRAGLEASRRRILQTGLFRDVKITVLGDEAQAMRDLLVEVEEQRTGSVSFGAAISSDAGVLGAFDLQQRNFDISDVPESWSELFRGQAFKGAGQQFGLSIQPGDELQRYTVNWSDPALADSDYFLGTRFQFFTRQRSQYDEQRLGAFVRFGKRFGDVWSASTNFRYEAIEIQDVQVDAPVDVFDVEGDSTITGLGFQVARSTVDSRVFPTRGTRLIAGFEQIGALGGDYTFTRATAEGNAFFTVDEDFYGHKTVLSFRGELGYIFGDDAPVFERFYAGGHSSFRGFEFRGIGPRGLVMEGGDLVEGDDSVGGEWLMLSGYRNSAPTYRWYRVVDVSEVAGSGPYTRDVTLFGPDWHITAASTEATLLNNIVAVYEKTIRLETSGLWTEY
jgi:outer membrane protein insertion porin family